jgi:MFS family permease
MRGLLLALLMSSFSAMQFFFAPIWGRLSDRVGRRPLLLLGLVGSVVFYTLFGIASELGITAGLAALGLVLLFVARLGQGIAGATISTAQAVIADCTPPEKRAHGMALVGAAFGIGFTFGPLLGFASLFVDVAGAPGFAAAALSLIALVLAVARLPETLRAGVSAGRRRLLDWHGLYNVLHMPSIGILVITFFLATFAFGSLESTLALVNKLLLTGSVERQVEVSREALMTTERKNFLVFAYVGLILVVTQGFLYRRLVKRVGEVRFLRLGLVLMAVGLAGAVGVLLVRRGTETIEGLLPLALAVMTLAVMGFAFLTPSVQSLISRRGDPTRQGEILGVNQSASALARILGPFMGVSLFFTTPGHELPYVCGAVLLTFVLLFSFRIRQD